MARTSRPAWPPAPPLLLAAVCLAGALTVVVLGMQLTFFNDDWYFLLQRPGLESGGGLDTLLAPHNGNMVVLLALLYKTLVALFGMGSVLPFRLVMGATMACLGVLVYVFVRARLGAAIALAAAAVIVFLGPAAEDLLFFGALMDLGGALVAGLGALLLLERESRRADLLACALLVCAIGFSNAGLPFVVGAAVAVLLRRRPTQLWIAAVPAAVFLLWWTFYGSQGPSFLTLHNVEHLPRYVLDSVSAGLATITGLNHSGPQATLARGHVLTAVCALALVFWLARGGRPTARALLLAGAALTFWVLTGANFVPGREPIASRYQLIDAALLILLAVEVTAETRLGRAVGAERSERSSRWAVFGVCGAAALVVASNVDSLRGAFDVYRGYSDYAKADLRALEIARPLAPGSLRLFAPIARNPFLSGVTAGAFYAETDAHGMPPIFTLEQLARAPADERRAADTVLANAYRMTPTPGVAGAGCVPTLAGVLNAGPARPVADGIVGVRNLSAFPLVLGVSRFAPPATPVYIGFLAAHASVRVPIRHDSLALPWRVSVMTPIAHPGAAVAVCQS